MKVDWKGILATVAPALATAAGGPLAGVVTKTLAAKLLGKPDASQEEVEAAVAGADPQTLLQLRQINLEFEKDMSDAGIRLEEISADDRANARAREIALKDKTPAIIAFLVLIVTLFVEAYVVIRGLPANADGILVGRVLGTLDAATLLILGYYYGTSASSHRKDQAIQDIAKR